MTDFSFSTAGQIIFGRGRAEESLPHVLGFGHRVLVLRGSHPWADHACDMLRAKQAEVLSIQVAGEPDLPALETVLARGRAFGADVVLAVGGGSVLDMGTAAPLVHLEVVGQGLPLSVLKANRQAAAARLADLSRYEEVETWIAGALGCPATQALDQLDDAIEGWGLPRLGQWLADDDLTEIARMAGASSSMKANPQNLSLAVLEAALRSAL